MRMKSIAFKLMLISVCQLADGLVLQSSTTFHNVLQGMQVDPMENMNVTYPVLTSIPWNQIEDCYEYSVGTSQINIFNSTIVDVIREYFVCQLLYYF